MKHYLILILFFSWLSGYSQESSFSLSTSYDTVYLGNYLEVKFNVENLQGKFIEPEFRGFKIISGPNTFTSMSIINGEMKSTQSYSYYIKPQEVGEYIIGPAKIETGEETIQTPEKKIIVLANPNNIIQNSKEEDNNIYDELVKPSHKKPVSKKKTYKI